MQVFLQNPQPGAHTPPTQQARAAQPLPSALPATHKEFGERVLTPPAPAWGLQPRPCKTGSFLGTPGGPGGTPPSQRGSSRRGGTGPGPRGLGALPQL